MPANRERVQPHLSATGWKVYWAWPCPPEQDPVFPTASPSHQEAHTSLLSSSIRGQTEEARTAVPQPLEWKPLSQKASQSDKRKLRAIPCRASGESRGRVLTKRGPLEKGMANHSSILASRTPWTVWKGKKIWHWKMSPAPPGWSMSNMLLAKGGEIAPERMTQLGQGRNDTQFWMCPVLKVKSNAVKNLCKDMQMIPL